MNSAVHASPSAVCGPVCELMGPVGQELVTAVAVLEAGLGELAYRSADGVDRAAGMTRTARAYHGKAGADCYPVTAL